MKEFLSPLSNTGSESCGQNQKSTTGRQAARIQGTVSVTLFAFVW